jgi:hypothetical protein
MRKRLIPFIASLSLILLPAGGLCMGQKPLEAPQHSATDQLNATSQQNATGTQQLSPSTMATTLETDREDASRLEQIGVLRAYFTRMMTLDDRLPEVFSRRVREGETMAFVMMREQQRRKGLLDTFHAARVYLDGLRFTRITADPDLARFRVSGSYSVNVGATFETIQENALFVLLPEESTWKIYERREAAD